MQDVVKLVNATKNVRDAALISCFYESNTRPHEFFNLNWTDIDPQCIPIKKRDNNGDIVNTMMDVVFLNLDGKTGPRRTFVVFSVPFLVAWKQAYLKGADGHIWIDFEKNLEQLKYAAATKVVRSAAKRAGISEKIKLYSFRHGKNTEVSEVLSYAQHCEYAGWTPSSDMPQVYNHLNGLNLVAPILSEYGIIVDRREDIQRAWVELYQQGMKLLND